MKLRKFKKKHLFWLIPLLLFLGWFCHWSNNSIQTSCYTYESEQVPQGFDGFRIVQLSDLHNKKYAKENKQLLEKIIALEPDLLVLTGDMVDGFSHTDYDKALLLLEQLPQIAPCYYVTGNHEERLKTRGLPAFHEKIQAFGISILSEDMVSLTAESGDEIALLGFADGKLFSPHLNEIMAAENQSKLHILLAHEPQLLEDYAATGVDIVFSGHAHGGQFRIPLTHQGIYAPDQHLFPQLTEGVHTAQNTTMYISRGLGNSSFPLRLCNRPELVCVTLRHI